MGMDVNGKAPRSERGTYLRQSVWGWRPLWRYCESVAPELTEKVQYAQSNDGDGLNDADSCALAALLTEEISSGRTASRCAIETAALAALPDEPCRWCASTGIRTDAVGVAHGMPDKVTTLDDGGSRIGWCNGCDGAGHVLPTATYYYTSVVDIAEFRDFLQDCGGFEIW